MKNHNMEKICNCPHFSLIFIQIILHQVKYYIIIQLLIKIIFIELIVLLKILCLYLVQMERKYVHENFFFYHLKVKVHCLISSLCLPIITQDKLHQQLMLRENKYIISLIVWCNKKNKEIKKNSYGKNNNVLTIFP